MFENKSISSLSISGKITLNLHSLNNEGGEGNQIITRQVTIVDKEGETHTVNAISGDMFKHIHVGHLINHSKEHGLPLCKNCQIFNPNRLSSGEDLGDFLKDNKDYTDSDVVDAIIELCTVDDTHGVLVTKIGNTNKNVPRKSIVEYGWTVGVPKLTNSESYLHTKFVPDSSGKKGEGTNEGQNIFHRPANHGVYAFVCSLDIYRIGLNDISRQYAIGEEERTKRYRAVLQSLIHSIIKPNGAMTSTQKPHITDFQGVITTSSKAIPAPTISAINDSYQEEIEKVVFGLNSIEKNSITAKRFNGIGELTGLLVDLMDCVPYKI